MKTTPAEIQAALNEHLLDLIGESEAERPSDAAACSESDPYEREAAKAAIHSLQRDLERERKRHALLEMDYTLLNQDIDEIREIITKGGTAAEILKFLDTPNA
jgi:hypothetical protein